MIPGQASELRAAPKLLLAALLGTVRRVLGDAASSSAAWFENYQDDVPRPKI